jgi:hypothetical protein
VFVSGEDLSSPCRAPEPICQPLDVVHQFRRFGHFKINAERSYMGRQILEAGSADFEEATSLVDRFDQSDCGRPPLGNERGSCVQFYASATRRSAPYTASHIRGQIAGGGLP